MTEKLFSYGTLQLEDVQIKNFGRKLESKADTLSQYLIKDCLIEDKNVVNLSGVEVHPIACFTGNINDLIHGRVFEITSQELHNADKYEVSDYKRVKCKLLSGVEAWVYIKK